MNFNKEIIVNDLIERLQSKSFAGTYEQKLQVLEVLTYMDHFHGVVREEDGSQKLFQIGEHCKLRQFSKGDIIFNKGDQGDDIHFIIKGTVLIYVPQNDFDLNSQIQSLKEFEKAQKWVEKARNFQVFMEEIKRKKYESFFQQCRLELSRYRNFQFDEMFRNIKDEKKLKEYFPFEGASICRYQNVSKVQEFGTFGDFTLKTTNGRPYTALAKDEIWTLSISAQQYMQIFNLQFDQMLYVWESLIKNFPNVKVDILMKLSRSFKEEFKELRETIFKEGQDPICIYLLQSGRVELQKSMQEHNIQVQQENIDICDIYQKKNLIQFEIPISQVGLGQVFGFEDFLLERPFTYSAISMSNSTSIFSISKFQLENILNIYNDQSFMIEMSRVGLVQRNYYENAIQVINQEKQLKSEARQSQNMINTLSRDFPDINENFTKEGKINFQQFAKNILFPNQKTQVRVPNINQSTAKNNHQNLLIDHSSQNQSLQDVMISPKTYRKLDEFESIINKSQKSFSIGSPLSQNAFNFKFSENANMFDCVIEPGQIQSGLETSRLPTRHQSNLNETNQTRRSFHILKRNVQHLNSQQLSHPQIYNQLEEVQKKLDMIVDGNENITTKIKPSQLQNRNIQFNQQSHDRIQQRIDIQKTAYKNQQMFHYSQVTPTDLILNQFRDSNNFNSNSISLGMAAVPASIAQSSLFLTENEQKKLLNQQMAQKINQSKKLSYSSPQQDWHTSSKESCFLEENDESIRQNLKFMNLKKLSSKPDMTRSSNQSNTYSGPITLRSWNSMIFLNSLCEEAQEQRKKYILDKDCDQEPLSLMEKIMTQTMKANEKIKRFSNYEASNQSPQESLKRQMSDYEALHQKTLKYIKPIRFSRDTPEKVELTSTRKSTNEDLSTIRQPPNLTSAGHSSFRRLSNLSSTTMSQFHSIQKQIND